jgi:putative flippase GtrA
MSIAPTVAGDAAGDGPQTNSEKKTLVGHPELRRFIKFCIVGFSSTFVSFAVLNLCHYALHLPLFSSLTAAFLLSLANGFYWNRKWTWKKARANSAQEQSLKFLVVNIVGFFLNTTIVVLIVAHFTIPGGILHNLPALKRLLWNVVVGSHRSYSKWLINGAQLAAIGIVMFWNYFANRQWTFKH